MIYNNLKGVSRKIERLHKDLLAGTPTVNNDSPVVNSDGKEQRSPFDTVRYLVVAGNFKEVKQWREDNSVSTNNAINVTDEQVIWDEITSNPVIIFTGTWTSRKDSGDLWQAAQRSNLEYFEEVI
jgi:hypothetical protein